MPLAQRRVHEAAAVHDEAGWRLDGAVALQPVLCLVPVGEVGKLVVVDDHQQVEIAAIALHRQRLVHPVAARIGAEQDDLQDTAALLPVRAAFRQRVLQFGKQDLDHAGQFLLLVLRQMIDAGFHPGRCKSC